MLNHDDYSCIRSHKRNMQVIKEIKKELKPVFNYMVFHFSRKNTLSEPIKN